jgi:hypothetical protein
MSLVLIEALFSDSDSSRLRAEFHQSLLAGSLARELLADPSEAEEAGIAAMFRTVGRLLIALFAPESLEEIRSRAAREAIPETAAARHVIGKGYEELTEMALAEWNLPERIVSAVSPLPQLNVAPRDPRERVRAVSQFADEVALSLRSDSSSVDRAIEQMLGRYAPALQLDRRQLSKVVDLASERARQLETACGVKPGAPVRLAERAPEELPPTAILEVKATEPAAERDASGRPANAREVLLAGLSDVTETLARGVAGPADINDVVQVVLESMLRGLGFARTAFALRDVHANLYRSRAGLGSPAARFSFDAGPQRDLFHAALAQATDLYIGDVSTEKVRTRLPDWFARDFDRTRSFLLMPIVLNQRPLGFLYADRMVVDERGLAADELHLLRTLRNQVVLAFRVKA